MKSVDADTAKEQFVELLESAERGQEILISRGGKPVARLVPHRSRSSRPVFGADRRTLIVPDDFDAPLPDDTLGSFER